MLRNGVVWFVVGVMVTKRRRNYIPLPEKLAAALACLLSEAQRKELRDRRVAAGEVLKLFDWHHIVFHAIGGDDLWFNLHPMVKAAHKERSSRDTSAIAKTKRLDKEWKNFTAKMTAPKDKRPEKKSRWGSRKLQSQGFNKRKKP